MTTSPAGQDREAGAIGAENCGAELTNRQFSEISKMVYQICGIKLGAGKEGLVKSRLAKRLRSLGLQSFDEYMAYIRRDASSRELKTMIDALTTNKTSFFREGQHFDFLKEVLLPKYRQSGQKVRIWSAACSTGEEPYSIATLLKAEWPDIDRYDVRVLATDISARVLEVARKAEYSGEVVKDVAPGLLSRHFTCIENKPRRIYRVNDDVRYFVRFAPLNLMDEWPMTGAFDLIFCRNVMIYFDKETQQRLVRRFWEKLEPDGYLFVGHSESLTSSSGDFKYVQPATYRKQKTRGNAP